VISTAWEAGLDQVVAVAIPGNAASRRVMEKLGMQFEGPTRYRDLDGVRYSILRPA
jgi:RimJ/RimL family protein N-acetyltransferase